EYEKTRFLFTACINAFPEGDKVSSAVCDALQEREHFFCFACHVCKAADLNTVTFLQLSDLRKELFSAAGSECLHRITSFAVLKEL
ncbi:MAG: hypothetical protein IJM23_00015, partial [Lachnospiraceae bacterium]|nr:hypothetical protein [Lachnospiraceae bacterium]